MRQHMERAVRATAKNLAPPSLWNFLGHHATGYRRGLLRLVRLIERDRVRRATWRHVLPCLADLITAGSTPRCLAHARVDTLPVVRRISRTCASVSLACCFASPTGIKPMA